MDEWIQRSSLCLCVSDGTEAWLVTNPLISFYKHKVYKHIQVEILDFFKNIVELLLVVIFPRLRLKKGSVYKVNWV